MAQRDIVLRWIEQIARVVARLLHGPGPVDLELARDQVQDALAQHLGPLQAVLPRLDVSSGAQLLHDPDRIFGYAQLLALLSAVEQAATDPGAPATRSRAIAFAREAIDRAAPVPEEWVAWLAAAEAPPAPPE
jgi:hypothetical protein